MRYRFERGRRPARTPRTLRQRGAPGGDQAGTADLALFEPSAKFENGVQVVAGGQHGREPGLKKLPHALHGLFGEPLVRVSADHVAVRIDEPRHDGQAARVDDLHTVGIRRFA